MLIRILPHEMAAAEARAAAIEAAEAVDAAKSVVSFHEVKNASGLSPEERVDAQAEYRLAVSELQDAERRYEDAVSSYISAKRRARAEQKDAE